MNKKDKIMNRMKEHCETIENQGLEIVGLFLQGSQNYELDYEYSDVDTKAIVLPKLDDFILNNKPISTTHIMENEEHVDTKDIRIMFDNFKKQNINFIEILFTDYKIMNPKYENLFQPMFDNRERLARYNVFASLNCMAGMSMEKYKALEHPYPSTMNKIEMYGYDPKQLHHIIRLKEFIKRYLSGESYKECLVSKYKEYLIEVKRGIHTLAEARSIAEECNQEIKHLKDYYMLHNEVYINKDVDLIMKKVLVDIFKYNFKCEAN